jgi:hypothetical protein
MTFTVTWKPSAIEALAHLWLDSSSRNEVSKAADELDSQLRERPIEVGEPSLLNSRVAVCLPLAVVYDVQIDDRVVHVLMVVAVPSE